THSPFVSYAQRCVAVPGVHRCTARTQRNLRRTVFALRFRRLDLLRLDRDRVDGPPCAFLARSGRHPFGNSVFLPLAETIWCRRYSVCTERVNQKLQGVIFALIARAVPRRKKLGSGLGFLWLLILLLVSNNSFDALLGESDFRLA